MPLVIINNIVIDGWTVEDELVIPDGVTCIADSAFISNDGLTSVTFPNTLVSIEDNAFYKCPGLTDITFPDSLVSIGEDAFCECEQLSNITFSDSIKNIGGRAFLKTQWIQDRYEENPLVIVNGILIDGQMCVGDVTLPDTITSIQSNAFGTSSNITSLVIPESVTFINSYAITNILDEAYETANHTLKKITFLGKTTVISPHASDAAAIYGYRNSSAEAYAKECGFQFVALDTEPVKNEAFYDVTGNGDGITLSDAQMCLKLALKLVTL